MWRSGFPTVATSGATFLTDPRWGAWRGSLAVAKLKGQGVLLMRMNPTPGPSRVVATTTLPQVEGIARIRTLMEGPDGALWLTTSNGTNDRIVRIAPTATVPVRSAGQLILSGGVALARTGTEIDAFVRSTRDEVWMRRSTTDGASWAGWTGAGVHSTDAPSAASSAAGRVDLVTRSATGSVVHSWFTGGTRRGSTDLGGRLVAQHAASLGDGTLDVFAVRPSGEGVRKHWNGSQWGGVGDHRRCLHLGVVGLGRPGPRGDRRERPRHQRRDLRAGVLGDRRHHRVGPAQRRAVDLVRPRARRHLARSRRGSRSAGRPTGGPSSSAGRWWWPRRPPGPRRATSCRARTAAS